MKKRSTLKEISRRQFLTDASLSGAGLAVLGGLIPTEAAASEQGHGAAPPLTVYVSPHGNDSNRGTEKEPLATLQKAQQVVRNLKTTARRPIDVVLMPGTFYIRETLTFGPEDSGTPQVPITYRAMKDGAAVISGGRRLKCSWRPYKDGIFVCDLPEARDGKLSFSELYVNGRRQIRARYPNGDSRTPQPAGYIFTTGAKSLPYGYPLPPSQIAGESSLDKEKMPKCDPLLASCAPYFTSMNYDSNTFTRKHWAHPEDAVAFVFQRVAFDTVPFYNGQWRVRGVDRDRHAILLGEGGYQQVLFHYLGVYNPGIYPHMPFYVENVFEELDAPGEWYLDGREGRLYYMPAKGVDLETAVIEPALLQRVVEIKGTRDHPVRHLSFRGIHIANAASTYFEPYSPAGMGDYSIHRGGAMFVESVEDIRVDRCSFDGAGGNAFFVNQYARRVKISNCRVTDVGESGICFVGKQIYREDKRFKCPTCGFLNWWGWDPPNDEIPLDCEVTNNLVHDVGVFAKQCAGLFMANCQRIKVLHNEIYNVPRAGINLNNGRYGGHLFEFNDVHDCVRETADHGPLNAYGREPFWCQHVCHAGWLPAGWPNVQGHEHHSLGSLKDVSRYARETTIIRNNRFSASRERRNPRPGIQFGIDLDDGASNYEVCNNLCVDMGVKTNTSAFVKIHDNIIVNGNIPLLQPNRDNHVEASNNTAVAGPGGNDLGACFMKKVNFGLTDEFPASLRDRPE